MFFDKKRYTPGHSQRIYWLWPVVIVVVVLWFFLRSGVEPTRDMDKPSDYWVRVLLYRNLTSCSVSAENGFELVMPDESVVKFSDDKFLIESSVYGFKIDEGIFSALSINIKPLSPFTFKINDRHYRGNLRLVFNEDGTFDAVNHVPLEAYTASVVGAEVPRYWDMDAMRAQAVASRTYCMYYKKNYGFKRHYDVRKTQASQVYKGLASEDKNSRKAAIETVGLVMQDGDKLFPAYFSSSCGGHTEDASEVFGKGFETLKGKVCTYCEQVARKKDYNWKPYKISQKKVTQKLIANYPAIKKLGEVVDIKPRRKRDFGQHTRWTNVELVGKNGKTITLRGEDLRLTLDSTGMKIKSTIFELAKIDGYWVFFSGRGFGHGVGMCQCGAQSLARAGHTYKQILNFYYNDPKFVKLY